MYDGDMNIQTHNPVHPFNYELDSNENAYRYGKYYQAVILADGRELMFNADQVIITATGDLLALSKTVLNSEGVREPLEDPKTVLTIASGFWTAHYAASAMTGDPICIDSIPKPKS